MPEPLEDPFLKAAIRLGFLKAGEADKAAREAVRSGQRAETWLLGRGILTPREVERVRRLAGLGRRSTTRSQAAARPGGAGGLIFALFGFVLVLGVGIFLFRDRILGPPPESPEPAPVTANQPPPETTPTGPGRDANESAGREPDRPGDPSEKPAATPETGPDAVPSDNPEKPGPDRKPPEPSTGSEPPAGKQPDEPDDPPEGTGEPEPPPPPPPPRRDPAELNAGHDAFARGETLNARVGEAEGDERLDTMEKALEAYTEALTHYRKYAGTRVPMHLEQRWAEVNNRIAILRKLMPPDRAARFIDRIVDRKATAAELLSRADASSRESPLNHTLNYMLYQRVLDEHPHAPEAVHALKRIAEIGWMEIMAVSSRKLFHRRLETWKKAMRAGQYEFVARDLDEVRSNDTVRLSMQRQHWHWHQTVLRALRTPKAALNNLIPGEVIRLKKRGGGQVRGKIEEILPYGFRLVGGRQIPVGDLDTREIIRLAFPDSTRKGSELLTLACFLALSGHVAESLDALERAEKLGVPIDDYQMPIRRLEYEEKQKAKSRNSR